MSRALPVWRAVGIRACDGFVCRDTDQWHWPKGLSREEALRRAREWSALEWMGYGCATAPDGSKFFFKNGVECWNQAEFWELRKGEFIANVKLGMVRAKGSREKFANLQRRVA